MASFDGVSYLSDDELLTALERLVGDDARITATVVAHLAEVDERRLHARAGYPSLFAYCTGALHLSEPAAYLRIQAARVSRRCPRVLEALSRGELSLSAVKLLDQHLTPDSQAELIRSATHKTVRELELLLAERFPRPDVPTRLRKLPELRTEEARSAASPATLLPHAMRPASEPACSDPVDTERAQPACPTPTGAAPTAGAAPTSGVAPPACPAPTVGAAPTAGAAPTGGVGRAPAAARVVPLAPARYKLELTLSEATRDKLRRAQELLRHAVPSGDVEQLLSRALDLLIEKTEKRRFGAAPKRKEPADRRGNSFCAESDAAPPVPAGPPPVPAGPSRESLATNECAAEAPPASRRSRHVPASVRRAVYQRDGGRCAYVAPDGRRCATRNDLEFHHLTPHACGGPPTVDNLEIRCRLHNREQAERDFGRVRVEGAIARARSSRRPACRGRTGNDRPDLREGLDPA